MKKAVIFLVALVSLLVVMTSCNAQKMDDYSSVIVNTANDGVFRNKPEVSYWTGKYYKKIGLADRSCNVYGKTYTGSYDRSIVDKMNSYTTDIYLDENRVEFGVRRDNGNLVYINLMNAEFFKTEPYLPEVNDPYESSIQLATEIAGEYITVSDYERIVEDPVTRHKEKDGVTYEISYYVVTFAKKIGHYYSSDYISIKVTSKGHLASIMMGDINAFANTGIDIDESRLEKSISEKTTSVYSTNSLEVVDSKITDQKIVLTPDGYICLYSTMEVSVVNASNVKSKTELSVLTVLGRKGK